jgi:hypothetical protein
MLQPLLFQIGVAKQEIVSTTDESGEAALNESNRLNKLNGDK